MAFMRSPVRSRSGPPPFARLAFSRRVRPQRESPVSNSKSMTRYRSCAILVGLLVACVTVRVQADPLRLVLACSQAPEMMFRFTIQNVSAASSAVVIGAIFGSPPIYLPYRLELTVKRAGVSDTILTYVPPSPIRIGGRVDPWADSSSF